MQSVSSRIWTRVAVSISYNNNDYTSENYSDEVAQRTVNRILWGRDTCYHLKVEH